MNKSMRVFSELILRKTIIPNLYLLRWCLSLMNSGRETANYFGFPLLQGYNRKKKRENSTVLKATKRIAESEGSYKMIGAQPSKIIQICKILK